ncbi:hypothetical protein SAMN05661080_03424 [Modestobacter sp. DSM 44400]|uniref:hypothetical protein n=1 Tax=Modestobacter sp. DSM 44400 TaxID=1550230 RepID=UPI00089C5D60|nr:hypothetical protein [Modestobacter sp. DSM 44400]SDY42271.1 hypothetical protein SAMN05661080_03424 [Modestobacter sp. DSM 44400]
MTTTLAARPVPLVVAVAGALLIAGLVLAAPAAAIEDPAAPTAAITHGPSCGPGVVRVQVTNGDEEHRVALVFGGTDEQDAAVLAPGQQAELRSTDVDWGITVDVSVTVTSADGATVDEPLEFGTYTRPSREDCDAISGGPGEPTAPAGGAPTTAAPATSASSRPNPASGEPRATGTPRPIPPIVDAGAPAAPTGMPSTGGVTSGGRAADPSVAPGGAVTVHGTGFTPGEPVHVSVPGVDDPLTTVTAAVDGTVEAVVHIPHGTDLGPLTLQLVGQDSATIAGLDLQVAAQQAPVSAATPVPGLAAISALLMVGGALGLSAARRPRTGADGVAARRR